MGVLVCQNILSTGKEKANKLRKRLEYNYDNYYGHLIRSKQEIKDKETYNETCTSWRENILRISSFSESIERTR